MKILAMSNPERWATYIKDPDFLKENEITFIPFNADDQTIIEAGKDAEVVVAEAVVGLNGNVIRNMKNLKMIHSEGVGYNSIDVKAASECGIYVCNCKAMNATAVAEQTILLMLGLLRGIISGDRDVREGRQMQIKEAYMNDGSLKELADCRIGFIGLGDIGKAAAKICMALGAKLAYYDIFRLPEEKEAEYQVTYMPLDELLAACDIISLHIPVTPETTYMVNKEFFGKMKEGSFIINTARGELIVTQDLLDALKSGHLAGAGLDCMENEPVSLDNPLLHADAETEAKIIFSPHIGGITGNSFRRGYGIIRENIAALARGEKPKNCVNSDKI